jgi:type I restriction-modification system DNA methylase subunit
MSGEHQLPSAKAFELFYELIDLQSPEAQAAVLDRACGAGHLLRGAVESLLKNHTQDDLLKK